MTPASIYVKLLSGALHTTALTKQNHKNVLLKININK